MEETPAQPRRGGRRRGNRRDDDDEVEEQQQQVQEVHPNGLLNDESQKPPLPPVRFAAKAPAAAPQYFDPVEEPRMVPPPAPDSTNAADSTTGGAHPSALSNLAFERDVYNLNFDTLTYDDLMGILKKVTHTQMEALVVQEQQNQLLEQQERQRLERFLDVGIDYRGSNASSPHRLSPTSEDFSGNRNEANEEGYTYYAMLTHLFEALNRNNEGSAMTERNPIPVPILEKIGKKKTAISNFGRICEAFHRSMEDVKDFIEKELSIRGNLDSNNALILKFEIRKATDFDRTLIKYLDEYVKCYSCHRIDTTLTKDGRRLELRCNWCTATRTVQAMSSATYSAQIEKRSRQRAAMTL